MFPGFFYFYSLESISIFLQSLGQPSETNPTLGTAVRFDRVKNWTTLQDLSPSSFFCGAACPGKPGKGKPAKMFLVWFRN